MIQIDMDMPENCGECRFRQGIITITLLEHQYICSAAHELKFPQEDNWKLDRKPDWCPLRQVVTCGECRYNPKIATGDDYGECICVCEDSYYSIEPKDEWFCWKGKKKC